MNTRLLLILICFLAIRQISAQDCPNFNAPAPLADSCSTAPFLCGNYLDNYCSSNAGLGADSTGGGLFSSAGYLRWAPCEDSVSLQVMLSNCSAGDGLAFTLLTGACDSFTIIQSDTISSDSQGLLNYTGMSSDSVYFLQVSGVNGSECQFSLQVLYGIGTTSPASFDCDCTDGMVDGPGFLCPGDIANYTIIPPDCTVEIQPGAPGNGYFCEPPIAACGTLDPDSIQLIWHIPPFMNFLSDSINVNTIQVQVNPNLIGVDTMAMDSVWVEWSIGGPPPVVDSTVFCDCFGCGGSINGMGVSMNHDVIYEFCELTCENPFCEINGDIYDMPGQFISGDNCQTWIIEVFDNTFPPDVNVLVNGILDCSNDQVALEAISNNPNAEFEWFTDSGTFLGFGPTLVVSDPGGYQVHVIDFFTGCEAQAFAFVDSDYELPIADAGPDISICPGESATLSATGSSMGPDFSYQWSDGQNGITIMVNPTETTTYTLTVTDNSNGCTSTDTVMVIVEEEPGYQALSHDCLPSNTAFTVGFEITGTPPFKVDGSTLAGTYYLSPPMPNGQDYAFVVEQANGCLAIVNGNFDCSQLCGSFPGTIAGDQIKVCLNESVELSMDMDAQSAAGHLVEFVLFQGTAIDTNNVVRYFSGSELDLTGLAVGSGYSVIQLVGPAGTGGHVDLNHLCTRQSNVVTIEITPLPALFNLEITMPVCAGESNGSIQLLNAGEGQAPFEFGLFGEDPESTPLIGNLSAGDYTLYIRDANGCIGDTSALVPDPAPLSLEVLSDQTLLEGQMATLLAEAGSTNVNYSWYGPADQFLGSGSVLEFAPEESGWYSCEVESVSGCLRVDSAWIELVKHSGIYRPNVIKHAASENANRYFTFYQANNYLNEIELLQVFDRWGNLVFERRHFAPGVPELGWDGTFRGKRVEGGVYQYVGKVIDFDGNEAVYSGNVTVVN